MGNTWLLRKSALRCGWGPEKETSCFQRTQQRLQGMLGQCDYTVVHSSGLQCHRLLGDITLLIHSLLLSPPHSLGGVLPSSPTGASAGLEGRGPWVVLTRASSALARVPPPEVSWAICDTLTQRVGN